MKTPSYSFWSKAKIKENMSAVPKFKQYYASMRDMNSQQKQFYKSWLKAWQKGQPIDVEGQVSYLFCYVYSILEKSAKNELPEIVHSSDGTIVSHYWQAKISERGAEEALPELIRIRDAYSNEKIFVSGCSRWISDCLVILRRYREALDTYPVLFPDARSSYATDSLLSLKVNIGSHVSGRDVLTLCGPKVTEFGKKHLDIVMQYIETILRSRELNTEINTLKEWMKDTHQGPYQVFNGTIYNSSVTDIECYSFSLNKGVVDLVKQLTREAENTVREEAGLPKVGEGWVGETELYYEIKTALQKLQVQHHARPDWLHNQHLDIYIPDLNAAIEYQGIQHREPIEFFGGPRALDNRLRLDAKKRRCCQRNGVRLIYVRSGYVLRDVLEQLGVGKATG